MPAKRASRTGRARSLSNDELTELAVARFAPLIQGGGPAPFAALSKKFPWAPCDPGVISRAIGKAFKLGLVELRCVQQDVPERDELLEERLRDVFEELDIVRVAKIPPDLATARNQRTQDREAERKRDDAIHELLGKLTAQHIDRESAFPSGALIGVGSGRGVFAAVTALQRRTVDRKLKAKGVTVASLTGAMHVKAHAGPVSLVMDADQHVGFLSQCFRGPVHSRTLGHSVTWHPHRGIDLPGPLTHALAGVGVLGPGHRFYDFARNYSKERALGDDILGEVGSTIRALVDECEALSKRHALPNYYPVGDICNHLVVIEPPPSASDATRARILENVSPLVRALNKRLLTVSLETLSEVPDILLVAGTRRKALAIFRLLDSRESHLSDGSAGYALDVRRLFTDAETALDLIALAEARTGRS